MAIALDAATVDQTANATSITFSHTTTGSDRIIFVSASNFNTNGDLITGVTYGGVSMTLVGKQLDSTRYCYLFVLHAPASGANDVVVSASTTTNLDVNAVSYTGAEQTSTVDSTVKAQTASTSTTTMTTTTVADDCWLVASMFINRNQTASTGVVRDTAGPNLYIDSNASVGSAGSYSLVTTQSDSASRAYVIASFAPVAEASTFVATMQIV